VVFRKNPPGDAPPLRPRGLLLANGIFNVGRPPQVDVGKRHV
jgi:hypothetical protein